MSAATKIQPEYEALGIHPDTMTCVAIMPERDAKAYVWALATYGIAATASRDVRTPAKPVSKALWHVAVEGGLAYNPAAYFASIRGEADVTCDKTEAVGQHPLERNDDR